MATDAATLGSRGAAPARDTRVRGGIGAGGTREARERTPVGSHGPFVDTLLVACVAGDSWAIVGTALGITNQAAQQRFGQATGNDARSGLT